MTYDKYSMDESSNNEFSIEKFMHHVGVIQARNPTWRRGQTNFNVLYIFWPELAMEIRDTPADPYYSDTNLDAFFVWLTGK